MVSVSVADMFERAAERLLAEDPDLERGRMFGSVGLKTGGKVFAMLVKGALVVKVRPHAWTSSSPAVRAGRSTQVMGG